MWSFLKVVIYLHWNACLNLHSTMSKMFIVFCVRDSKIVSFSSFIKVSEYCIEKKQSKQALEGHKRPAHLMKVLFTERKTSVCMDAKTVRSGSLCFLGLLRRQYLLWLRCIVVYWGCCQCVISSSPAMDFSLLVCDISVSKMRPP